MFPILFHNFPSPFCHLREKKKSHDNSLWWKTYWVWMMPTMKATAIISPPPAVWLTLSGQFDKLQLKSLRTLGLLPTEVICGTMFPLADKQASKFRVGDQVCCFVSEWQRQLKPPMSRQPMNDRRDGRKGKKKKAFLFVVAGLLKCSCTGQQQGDVQIMASKCTLEQVR